MMEVLAEFDEITELDDAIILDGSDKPKELKELYKISELE